MKDIKILTITTAILFSLSGCGGGSTQITQDIQEQGDTTTDDIKTLEFKSDGKYDLIDYLFPTILNQKTFKVKTYNNDTDIDDNIYGDLSDDLQRYRQTIEKNSENEILFKKDGKFELQYTILDDRMQLENNSTSNPIDIVRFADIGDYLGTLDMNGSNGLSIECRLNAHLESKNNFKDILDIVCQTSDKLYRSEYFFSKGIGSILEIDSICKEDLNCTNIVTEYEVLN